MSHSTVKQKYDNLDGFRTIAAIGIIMMHILVNGDYGLSGGIFAVICTFGNFVRLFFIISGFGMCCGYYERIKNNEISINTFFLNRYKKILPFFSLLVLVDLVFAWDGVGSLIEGFANITLMYGFLPYNSITVIGVGWTLGVIFAFYLLFPFFVVLIWDKKCAWISLFITFVLGYICVYYFDTSDNFLRFFFYFIAGGLLYLYRDNIAQSLRNKTTIMRLVCASMACLWMVIPSAAELSTGGGAVFAGGNK